MKMMYNGTQIKSLNIKHYELSSNDCDMIASDLQAGKTAVARGKKITGTGKSFEFAFYGHLDTNLPQYVPNCINVIGIGSSDYPVQLVLPFSSMHSTDFSVRQNVASIFIDNVEYAINIVVENNLLTISCDETITLEIFFGKDNYV